MAVYAIGDVQGCFRAFRRLLEAIAFRPRRDELWLLGDLVNRGPQSLEMLRWCSEHRDSIRVVLGNHDVHALGIYVGARQLKTGDTLQPLLDAPDADALLGWLRLQEFFWHDDEHAIVHAGIHPGWTIEDAAVHGQELADALQGPGWQQTLRDIYAASVRPWRDSLVGTERLRSLLSIMTRLRVCNAEGRLLDGYSGGLQGIPADWYPWFGLEGRRSRSHTIYFGHWSALGLYHDNGVYCLDTGCIWGRALTAVSVPDGRVTQVTSGA